ncbi:MAG: hypothetical protein R3Y60_02980 [bacterium]
MELLNEEVTNEEVVNEEVTTTKAVEPKKNNKKKKDEPENWFIKVLKEEHKWETYLLGFISCVAMGIGALVLSDVLVFKDNTPVLGEYSTVVGWVFVAFGLIGFLLFIIPIFKPTKKEIKHLSLPSKGVFGGNVARVFIFLIFMASVFLLYDAVISAVLGAV